MAEDVKVKKPDRKCPTCGADEWVLREASQYGKAEYICGRCHPKPKEGNNG